MEDAGDQNKVCTQGQMNLTGCVAILETDRGGCRRSE